VNCTDAAKYRSADFRALYDGLTNQEYVDKLFQTTYGKAFYDQQFTRAFVQLEYFGYMSATRTKLDTTSGWVSLISLAATS
jgi:hypothetical protein